MNIKKGLFLAFLTALILAIWFRIGCAVKVTSGSFAANTSTGNQTVDTGVDSVLKAIRFYGTLQTATGLADVHSGFHGFAVSSSARKVVAWASDDNAATTNTGKKSADLAICILSDGTPTVDGEADFVSFGTGANAGEFTVNWTNAPASAYLVYYEAYYGNALTNVAVTQHAMSTGTGNQSFTGLGFTPDFLFAMTSDQTALGTQSDLNFSVGFGLANNKTFNINAWADDADGAGGYSPVSMTSSRLLECNNVSGTISIRDSLVSLDVDGFTINKLVSPTANTLIWILSMRGGQYDAGSFSAPTAGGTPQDQSATTTFLPGGVTFLSTTGTSLNSNTSESHIQFGFGYDSSGTIKERYAFGITDNVRNPTITGMGNNNDKCIFMGLPGSPPTADGEADYKTQNATSFTVTWTDLPATAKRVAWAAFGDNATPSEACPTTTNSPRTAAGQFTTPFAVVSSNNVRATETTVNDTMVAYDFDLAPTSGSTIDGVLVEVEAQETGGTAGDQGTLQVRLSWNGGTNATATEANIWVVGDGESYKSYGGSSFLWGRSWTVSEFTNANFRVIMIYSSEDFGVNLIEVDHVRVTVYCTAAGGGDNIRRRRILRGELKSKEEFGEKSPFAFGHFELMDR